MDADVAPNATWSDDPLWGDHSDDEAVLAAALELIEATCPPLDADDETVALSSSPAPSSSSTETDERGEPSPSLQVRVRVAPTQQQNQTTRRRRGRPRTVTTADGPSGPLRRNRTKEAIAQLRPLARALESQLHVLCLRRELESEPGSVQVRETDQSRARREAWKAMAERQLVQRRRAESERERLRATLAEQTATLRKLQRVFAHHENRLRSGLYSGLRLTAPVAALRRRVAQGATTDVLESLTLALGQMHLHTDAVLADPRFATPGSSFVEVKTESEPFNGTLAVQLMDTRLVPFSMERTVEAVWTNLMHRADQRESDPLAKGMVQSQFVTFVPGFYGHVEASMALHRITEPTRVVMVRCSVFTYRRDDEETAMGPDDAPWPSEPMTLHHFLWTSVSRPTDRSDECQIHTCFISVPNLSESDNDRNIAITQLCADVSKYFNTDAHDEVDNLLLCDRTH